ncbi:MAG: hypothetical protein PVI23_10305 [Maricaulaceae bacterium]|jgi:hypothetical protein
MGESYKRRIRAQHTRSYLTREEELSRSDENKLEALSNAELAAAAVNPDHSASGRARAEQLLITRGGALEDARIVVPGFVRTSDITLLRRNFFGLAPVLRGLIAVLAVLFLLGALGSVPWLANKESAALRAGFEAGVITEQEYDVAASRLDEAERDAFLEARDASSSAFKRSLLERMGDAPEAQALERAKLIAVSAFLTALGLNALWLVLKTLRRQPARVLLLRTLDDKPIAKTAENLIENHLLAFGHVITFADSHFRPAQFAWFWRLISTGPVGLVLTIVTLPVKLILRLFNRAKSGLAKVRSAGEFRSLAWRLRDRLGINYNVAVSSKDTFMVRPSDAWRAQTAALLVGSAHVVLLDLTGFTDARTWELDLLDELDAWDRAFVLRRSDLPLGERFEQLLQDRIGETPVFDYDKHGDIANGRAFKTVMIGEIAHSVRTHGI